ncbi:MAG: hypothetical protein NT138_05810 [Planctomycetales bacterium]|nr:hypothetical protein [Planctomycetales bacterium]
MLDLLIDSILKLQLHDGFGDVSGKAFAGRFLSLQGPQRIVRWSMAMAARQKIRANG